MKELILLSYLDLANDTIDLFKSETPDSAVDLIDGNNWLVPRVYGAHLVCLSSSSLQITPSYMFQNSKICQNPRKKDVTTM